MTVTWGRATIIAFLFPGLGVTYGAIGHVGHAHHVNVSVVKLITRFAIGVRLRKDNNEAFVVQRFGLYSLFSREKGFFTRGLYLHDFSTTIGSLGGGGFTFRVCALLFSTMFLARFLLLSTARVTLKT